MASLDAARVNNLKAKGVIVNRHGQDTPIAIRMRYIGTGSVTSVTVTTATNIVMVTSDGGTDTYAFSTYSTLGLLVDAINSDGIFEAKILDSLRSAATASRLLDGAITAGTDENFNTVWDVKLDTSTALQYAVCLSPQAEFDAPKGHRAKLQEIRYSINMGTAAADSVQVWKRKGVYESQVMGLLSVDTTDTTIYWAGGEGFVTSEFDGDIIVLVKDAATLADATTNFLQVVGLIE